MPEAIGYIGRFAPSPTGPLHLGSLYTAVASFLDARANQGKWLLRIENLDPPREQAGAEKRIIESLHAHGLNWDGEILWQSQRHTAYTQALDDLLAREHAFYCSCSRRQLAKQQGIHRGSCLTALNPADAAIRLRAPSTECQFVDRQQGLQTFLAKDIGDVVLRRRDGLYAYQLAVVVDDIYQGVSHVVRGIDLLDSTPPQQWLFERLNGVAPQYLHLPVLVNQQGDKLSKQGHAPAIHNQQALDNLRWVLKLLGQASPPDHGTCQDLLAWSTAHWKPDNIPQQATLKVSP